jgi:hypothetical protein
VVASLEPDSQELRGSLNAAADPSLAPPDQSPAPITEPNDHRPEFHTSPARSGELAQNLPVASNTAHRTRPKASRVDAVPHDPLYFTPTGQNNSVSDTHDLTRQNLNSNINSLSAYEAINSEKYTQHYTLSQLNGFEIGAVPLRFTGDDRSSIHLMTFLSLFRSKMDPRIYEKLSAARAAGQYVSFTTLRDAGFSVSYDPKHDLLILEVR